LTRVEVKDLFSIWYPIRNTKYPKLVYQGSTTDGREADDRILFPHFSLIVVELMDGYCGMEKETNNALLFGFAVELSKMEWPYLRSKARIT
jgi:hypothetical protein